MKGNDSLRRSFKEWGGPLLCCDWGRGVWRRPDILMMYCTVAPECGCGCTDGRWHAANTLIIILLQYVLNTVGRVPL